MVKQRPRSYNMLDLVRAWRATVESESDTETERRVRAKCPSPCVVVFTLSVDVSRGRLHGRWTGLTPTRPSEAHPPCLGATPSAPFLSVRFCTAPPSRQLKPHSPHWPVIPVDDDGPFSHSVKNGGGVGTAKRGIGFGCRGEQVQLLHATTRCWSTQARGSTTCACRTRRRRRRRPGAPRTRPPPDASPSNPARALRARAPAGVWSVDGRRADAQRVGAQRRSRLRHLGALSHPTARPASQRAPRRRPAGRPRQ